MAFRQFPATGADGESYIIIEFKDDGQPSGHSDEPPSPRYELADGRHLHRRGHQFTTVGGELTLSIA
ncbi:hypothetical protein [Stenotrophomonas sp. YIM B06876]|uniref:hypothetical protein n=1 Tax=Stenotrophomonas sp. YIM B06876 TaxID=3060211 RepID=UPI002738C0AF|nr:hypothetical protein [Stenotrophomonas sp. YIM B06876]